MYCALFGSSNDLIDDARSHQAICDFGNALSRTVRKPSKRQPKLLHSDSDNQTLAGLPTFAPMTFHLFVSYSLMAVRRA